MRIEVIVGDEDPKIYPLSKPRIAIGSGDTCEIELRATGISRKHLVIVSEDDNYFVIDQGSTNGSFINEERLVPGRKVEFTSFFPVRLGDSVLISLLSDQESVDFVQETLKELAEHPVAPKTDVKEGATRAFSLKELQAARTENLVRKRNEKIVQKRSEARSRAPAKPEPDKTRMRVVKGVIFALFVGAVYYGQILSEPEPEPVIRKVGEDLSVPKASAPVAAPVPPPAPAEGAPSTEFLLESSELPTKEHLWNLLDDIKCVLDTEKYFCQSIAGADLSPWGASQVGSTVNVLVDGSRFLARARELLVKPDLPEERPQYEEEIKLVAAVFFIHEAIPATVDLELLKDLKLTFALFDSTDDHKVVGAVIAVKPEGLKHVKQTLLPTQVHDISNEGAGALGWIKSYLTVY